MKSRFATQSSMAARYLTMSEDGLATTIRYGLPGFLETVAAITLLEFQPYDPDIRRPIPKRWRTADVWNFTEPENYSTTSMPPSKSIATHEWSYRRIDGPTTSLAQAWNPLLSKRADKQSCDNAVSDSDESYQVLLATDHIISAVRNDWHFGHGAAYGGNDSVAVNLVGAENPHPLTPSDLFQTDKPWRPVLAALILAAMPEEVPGSKASDPAFAKTADKIAGNPTRWAVDRKGLTIQFEDYEIGSYSFGEPTITIPWYSLRAVMVSNAPVS